MTAGRAAAIALASTAAASAAGVLVLSGGGAGAPPAAATPAADTLVKAARKHPKGVRVGCSRRSEASFPHAFTSPRNLVVGPLVLVGGGYTPASVVREFGGNKFPLLVKAGHTVTVRLSRGARRSAGLAYAGLGRRGPLPQGRQLRERDAANSMTFIACRPGPPTTKYLPEGPSGSEADGESVTFWSGFVLTRAPACLPLEVFVDDELPRRVGLGVGRRCAG